MTVVLIFLILYTMPVAITYMGIRRQLQNEWKSLEPGLTEFVIVFTPLLNWGYSIFTLMSVGFDALGRLIDKMDDSKTNRTISGKKTGSKFFRLK